MAVAMRFMRLGTKQKVFYRIIVKDRRKKRDGGYIENLGTYNPAGEGKVTLKKERIQWWLEKGATVTGTLKSILKKHNINA